MGKSTKISLVKFKEVIECPLTSEMEDTVERMLTDEDAVISALLNALQDGYAVSTKANENGKGYGTSVMQVIGGKPNGGLMFFGNGPTPIASIAVAMVKLDFLSGVTDWLAMPDRKVATRYS